MSIIVEFELASDDFELGRVFSVVDAAPVSAVLG